MTSSVVAGDCPTLKRSGIPTEPLSRKTEFGSFGGELFGGKKPLHKYVTTAPLQVHRRHIRL